MHPHFISISAFISCTERSLGANYHFTSMFLTSAWGLQVNLLVCHGLACEALVCASVWLSMTCSSCKATQPHYCCALLKLPNFSLLDAVHANVLLIKQDGFQIGIRINSAVIIYCNKPLSSHCNCGINCTGVCGAGLHPKTLLSGTAICNGLQILKHRTDKNITVLKILQTSVS